MQVDFAGSMAIDDEMTDDVKYFGCGVLERCGVRLEQVHTLGPCAALALAVCSPNRPRWKPPSLAPSCRIRAALLLVVHRGRLPGAAAMLLVMPFPQDIVLRPH